MLTPQFKKNQYESVTQQQNKKVGVPYPVTNNLCGIGYIIIPTNFVEQRENYIRHCYNTGSVALYTKEGQFLQNVKLSKQLLDIIEFPINGDNLGSEITYIMISPYNKAVGIAVTIKSDDDILPIQEYSLNLVRQTETGQVSIIGDAKTGKLNITVDSETDNGGEFTINVINNNKTAKLNLNIKGDINLDIDGKSSITTTKEFKLIINKDSQTDITEIKYLLDQGFSYLDQYKNSLLINEDKIQIQAEKLIDLKITKDGKSLQLNKENFIFGRASEQLVLGNQLAALLREILTEIAKITVTCTAPGTPSGPPINAPIIISKINKIQSILSNSKIE